MENLNLVLPEIFISLSIMFLLVLGVFKNDSSKLIFNISLLVLLVTAIITLNETFNINRTTLFFGFYPDPLINTIEVSIKDLISVYNIEVVNN